MQKKAIQYQPNTINADSRHALHLYPLVLDLSRLNATRDMIVQEIRSSGIGATVHYRAAHLHPYFKRLGYEQGAFPESERISDSIITIPLAPSMSEDDVEYVAKITRTIILNHQIQ